MNPYFESGNVKSREILAMCKVLTLRVPFCFSTSVPKIDLLPLLMPFYAYQYNIYTFHNPTCVMPNNSLITIASQFHIKTSLTDQNQSVQK